MTGKEFDKIINDQLNYCKELLCQKNKEYNPALDNRFHSFLNAAALQGISPKKALAGMMAKHTISIYDMCESGSYSVEKWTEKITDHINYLLLLKALIIEQEEQNE